MSSFETSPIRETIKQKVLDKFLAEYSEKMHSEPDLYDADDLARLEKLAQGEKIQWDVQGADLLAKICQDFRLSPEEGIALRVQVFADAKVPAWYENQG